LETFEEVLEESSRLDIITQKNAAAEQFMSSSSNKVIKKLQNISDQTHWNNATEMTESVLTVINYPNKIFFSDMAYFVVQIYPPSGNTAGILYGLCKNNCIS
jgi:hypothetical protein